MGKTTKKEQATTDELDRKAAKFADEVRTPANEARMDAESEAAERPKRDFSYTQNREVSWLRFDNRVLDEAFDKTVPLFERIKFCAIFQSNMDEWFMIRVGGLSDLAELKRQPVDNKSNETPSQQLDVLFDMLPSLYKRREECLAHLEAKLAEKGVERVVPGAYTSADQLAVTRHFETALSPILSPMIVDPRHPFPNLRNDVLYVVCSLDGDGEQGVLGVVEVPPAAQRVIWLPAGENRIRYTLVEDVITSSLSSCFGSYVPTSSAVVRVTRNADIDPDGEGVEEEEDYREHMKKVLKRRGRLQPVRMELQGELEPALVSFVRKELGLEKRRVFHLSTPADLSYVFAIEGKLPAARKTALTFVPFEPQDSPMVRPGVPMRQQVEDHDVLLCYPYEGMGPLLRLLHEAANDDDCISIKITLYRVARHSRLCESLVTAVENGKEVTVLMELRARFDEQNNIEWADRLEDAGCTVIYGSEGFKCHSKICQITYHDSRGISRVTCLGTGNFNEKTARLYSDFMLLTAHPGIAEDGNAFFRNLSLGNLRGRYKYLGVAPVSLKPLVMRGIDREISRAEAGQAAQVFMKMNSLTDRDVIDRLAQASQAGVKVILIIRGICCMLPGVKGKTEGIEIRQIVGRLLEHARVYAFGSEADTIYLSSADMMTRNTERRVEICYPILDPTCRDMVIQYMDLQLADNVKARRLTSGGTWERVPRVEGEPEINCQEVLIAVAYARARRARGIVDDSATLSPVLASLPTAVVEAVLRRSGSTGLTSSLRHPGAPLEEVEPASEPMAAEGVAVAGEAEPATQEELRRAVAEARESSAASKVAQATLDAATTPSSARTAPSVLADATEAVAESVEELGREGATPVDARVIEPATPEPATGETSTVRPRGARETARPLAKREPGRLGTALALFGLGFKTLFGRRK